MVKRSLYLAFGLAVALLCLPAIAGASFAPSPDSPFAVGTNPIEMGTADLNGDGHADLVTANVSSSNVSVLLGNGSGGFTGAAGSPFAAGHQGQSIAIGDLNGDGHPDVVTTMKSPGVGSAGSASVLLGNGAGGLAKAACSPFLVSFRPEDVAIGDFNEDRKADLAILNSFLNLGVDIYLGDGTGCFSRGAGSPFAGGTDPRSVVVADFDEDGHADLAITNEDSMDVSLLLGNGSGGFAKASGSPFALGRFGEHGAVGDFNEDGHVDLAVANFSFFTISVLLGNGAGGLTAASGSPFPAGATPGSIADAVSLAVGDFNADRHLDLATAGTNQDRASVLFGAGTGSFVGAPGSPFVVGDVPQSVAAADFNEDGSDDLAVANTGSSNVTVLLSLADLQAPTINCTVPNQLIWHATNATVHCTAADNGSGLANAADASFSLSTAVAIGGESDIAATGSHEVCDKKGNCATAGSYIFKVDMKGPSLSCVGNPKFTLNEAGATVTANVSDGGSGPAGSPVSGPADTSSVGPGSTAVTGSDLVGNTTSASCAFKVNYDVAGFIAPVKNPPDVNTGKAGKAFPVKWQLRDANGSFISNLDAMDRALVKASPCDNFSTDPTGAVVAGTRGAGLQYDLATNSYNYKWSTAALGKGCYSLLVELDSGQMLAAYFNLK